MSNPSPPPNPPQDSRIGGLIGTVADLVRSLTINNVLIFGILVAISIPAYFAWLFLTDDQFRHEFMSTTRVVLADVPCAVYEGNIAGQGERISVVSAYGWEGRVEHLIAFRAAPPVDPSQIKTLCEDLHADIRLLRAAVRDREAVEKRP